MHRNNTHTQTHTYTCTHVLMNEWNNRNSATHADPSSCVCGTVSLPLSRVFSSAINHPQVQVRALSKVLFLPLSLMMERNSQGTDMRPLFIFSFS